MKRIETLSAVARAAFIRTVLCADSNGSSNYRCYGLQCENCPFNDEKGFSCRKKRTFKEWFQWAMEEVQ